MIEGTIKVGDRLVGPSHSVCEVAALWLRKGDPAVWLKYPAGDEHEFSEDQIRTMFQPKPRSTCSRSLSRSRAVAEL